MLHQKERNRIDTGTTGDSSRIGEQLSSSAGNNTMDTSTPRNQNYLSNIVDETKHLMNFNQKDPKSQTKNAHLKQYGYPEDGYSSSNLKDMADSKDDQKQAANYSYKSMVNPVIDDKDIEESEKRIHDLAQEKKYFKQMEDEKEQQTNSNHSGGGVGFLRRLSIGNKNGNHKKGARDVYEDDQDMTNSNDYVYDDQNYNTNDRNVNIKQRSANPDFRDISYDNNFANKQGLNEDLNYQSGDYLKNKSDLDYDATNSHQDRNIVDEDYYGSKTYDTYGHKDQRDESGLDYTGKDSAMMDYTNEKPSDKHDSHSSGENTGILASISNYLGMSGNADEDNMYDEKASKNMNKQADYDDSMGVGSGKMKPTEKDYSGKMPGALDSDLNDSTYGEEPQWHNNPSTISGNTDSKRAMDKNTRYDNSLNKGMAGVGTTDSGVISGTPMRKSKNKNNPLDSDSTYIGNSHVRRTDFGHDNFKASLLAPSGVDSTENLKNAQMHQKKMMMGQPSNIGKADLAHDNYKNSLSAPAGVDSTENFKNSQMHQKKMMMMNQSGNASKSQNTHSGDISSDMMTESQPYRLVQNPKDEQHLKSANAENLKIRDKSGHDVTSNMNNSDKSGSNMYGQSGYPAQKMSNSSSLGKDDSRILNSDYKGMKSLKHDNLNSASGNSNVGGSLPNDGYYAGTKGKSSHQGNFNNTSSSSSGTTGVLLQNARTGEYNTSGLRQNEDSVGYGNSTVEGEKLNVSSPEKKFFRDSNGKSVNPQTEGLNTEMSDSAVLNNSSNNKYLSNAPDDHSSKHDSNSNGLGKIKHLFTGKDNKKPKSPLEKKNISEHGTVFNNEMESPNAEMGYYKTSSPNTRVNENMNYQHDIKPSNMSGSDYNPRTESHKTTGNSNQVGGENYVIKNDDNGGTISYDDDGLQGTHHRRKSLIENIKEVF